MQKETVRRDKKSWNVYLMVPEDMEQVSEFLVFRDREITQNELIELLWPDEDVSDPANTLKVLVFRIRQIVDQIGLNGKSLIVSRREGKEVYYHAADSAQSRLLHEMIEQVMDIACPEWREEAE